jgi:hypothetical protein
MDTDDLERLTLLERAQLLHDATLRRHGDMLNRLEEARVQHAARLTASWLRVFRGVNAAHLPHGGRTRTGDDYGTVRKMRGTL